MVFVEKVSVTFMLKINTDRAISFRSAINELWKRFMIFAKFFVNFYVYIRMHRWIKNSLLVEFCSQHLADSFIYTYSSAYEAAWRHSLTSEEKSREWHNKFVKWLARDFDEWSYMFWSYWRDFSRSHLPMVARIKATLNKPMLLFTSAYMPVNNYYKFQAGKTGSSFTTCPH
jgi:hypothetical protein